MNRIWMVLCAASMAACATHLPGPDLQEPAPGGEGPQQEGLYSLDSRAVGWGGIDLQIREVETAGQVTLFHVPGYARRSADESRFVMCALSQYALLSGFSEFAVSNAPLDADHIEVGFFVQFMQDPEELFPPSFHHSRYPTAYELGLLCGFFDPGTGENRSGRAEPD